jgi:hypothetical protein
VMRLEDSGRMYTANVHLVLGDWSGLDDVNTLVDAGRDPAVLESLERAPTGVGKRAVEQVVLTHGHHDHIELLGRIRGLFRPRVCAFRELEGVDHVLADGEELKRVENGAEQIKVSLDQAPPENSCRPAVDVLFRSVAEVYGSSALAVVLTGMGQDGMRGAHALKARGASVIAQDEATSVVWGMPGAVVEAGLADAVIPLARVAPEILRRVAGN